MRKIKRHIKSLRKEYFEISKRLDAEKSLREQLIKLNLDTLCIGKNICILTKRKSEIDRQLTYFKLRMNYIKGS